MVYISVGNPSNYIIVGDSCSPDRTLPFIYKYLSHRLFGCRDIQQTVKKCQTSGQLFESLYIGTSILDPCFTMTATTACRLAVCCMLGAAPPISALTQCSILIVIVR